jgi:hypothetical protein
MSASTLPPVAPFHLAVERAARRADLWREGEPLEVLGELRSLCWAIEWQALTGDDLERRPDLLEALELEAAAIGLGGPPPERRRFVPHRRRDAARELDAAIAATGSGEEARARLRGERRHLALGWTPHRLARHAEIEARWHAEVDEVLDGRPVTAEDLAALPCTRALLEEPTPALVLVTLGQRWAFRAVAGRPPRRRIWLRPVRRR